MIIGSSLLTDVEIWRGEFNRTLKFHSYTEEKRKLLICYAASATKGKQLLRGGLVGKLVAPPAVSLSPPTHSFKNISARTTCSSGRPVHDEKQW